MIKLLEDAGSYELHELNGLSPEYLAQLDVVVLQNFSVGLEFDHGWVQALRRFVLAGGGLQEEARFATEFRDHMVFRAGNRGKAIIENVFGDPVYVLGEMGTGRVLFSSSYYGYTRPLVAVEGQAFLGCIEWLAQ